MTSSDPIKKICVFCGSYFGNKQIYADGSRELGETLAARNWGLVYGGGSTGLMGTLARGCATNGGYVHGIIPEALMARERVEEDGSTIMGPLPDSKEYGRTTLVKDMHTRKRMMAEESLAFVALPGGYGTLEELMEMVTWAQLNIHNKPIVIFNIDGFYDGFMTFVQKAIDAEFVNPEAAKIIRVATTAQEVLQSIEDYVVPENAPNFKWDTT